MSRVLVACYSRSGYTAGLAQEIVSMMDWDLVEIHDRHPRNGAFGALRCVLDSWLHLHPGITFGSQRPCDYDTVVLAAPVWMENLAAPMRSYICRHHGQFKSVAYVCTYGGKGAERAGRQVARLARVPLLAELAVTSFELEQADYRKRLDAFLSKVQARGTT